MASRGYPKTFQRGISASALTEVNRPGFRPGGPLIRTPPSSEGGWASQLQARGSRAPVVLELEARELAVKKAFARGVAQFGLRQMNAVVTAFTLGYALTDLAIDYWYSHNQGSTGGSPDLSGYTEFCRIGSGNYWDNSLSACGRTAWQVGLPVQAPTIPHGSGGLSEWTVSSDPFIENGIAYYNSMVVAGFSEIPGGADFSISQLPIEVTLPAYTDASAPPVRPYAALPYSDAWAHPLSMGGEPSLPVGAPVGLRDLPRRPGPRVRERKWKLKDQMGIAGVAMNIVTESIDGIDALFEALPEWAIASMQDEKTFTKKDGTTFTKMVDRFPLVTVYVKETIRLRDGTLKKVNTNVIDYQFRSKGSALTRAKTVWNNAALVDRVTALKNLAVNQAQDAAFGKLSAGANRNLAGRGWSSARGISW